MGKRSSWTSALYLAHGTAVAMMVLQGWDQVKGRASAFSQHLLPSKPCLTTTTMLDPSLDSKMQECLGRQPRWEWRKANTNFQGSYICKNALALLENAETANTQFKQAINIACLFLFLILEALSLKYFLSMALPNIWKIHSHHYLALHCSH